MANTAELKRERLAALREARKVQRTADTAMEVLERRIFRMLDRKTIIDRESALTLVPLWNDFIAKARLMEAALADFISICSI